MAVADQTPGASAREDGRHSRLRVHLRSVSGATVVADLVQRGRLVLGETRDAVDGRDETIVHYPADGVRAGDRLECRLDATDGAVGSISTSNPIRLSGTSSALTLLERRITVSASSSIEWIPGLVVAGAETRSRVKTRIILEEGSTFIGSELVTVDAGESSAESPSSIVLDLVVRQAGATLLDVEMALPSKRGEVAVAHVAATPSTGGSLAARHLDDILATPGVEAQGTGTDWFAAAWWAPDTETALATLRRLRARLVA